MTTQTSTPTATFTAHLGPDMDGQLSLVVVRSITAGISGPWASRPVATGTTVEALEVWLRDQHGLYVSGPWTTTLAYDGLRLETTLARA